MPPTHNVERLLSLALTLTSSTRGLTREEITEFVPGYDRMNPTSVRRQFARDLARLSRLGLDVSSHPDLVNPSTLRYTASAREGRATTASFTETERLMLASAAAMWNAESTGSLGARIRAKLASYGISTTAEMARGALGSSPATTPLLEALESRQSVVFSYRSSTSQSAQRRKVEPWALDVVDGREYLYGFDLEREAPRLFRVSRIESIPLEGPEAKHPRHAHPPIRELLSESESREDDEPQSPPIRVRIAPFKALALRTALGLNAAESVIDLPASRARGLLESAWAEPLWVSLEGERAVALTWKRTRERIAALHAGSPSLTWEEARSFEKIKLKRARDVGSGEGELTRLSAEIAYLHAHGEVDTATMAKEFGLTNEELEADLEVIYNAGDYSRGYDDLVDVIRDDGYVSISGAESLAHPMQLSASETSALLMGLEALSESGTSFPSEDLRGLTSKLTALLPEGTAVAEVPSDPTPTRETEALRRVLRAHARRGSVRIMYSPPTREGVSVRDIKPLEVSSRYGMLYIRAYCELSEAEREFRSDRIVESWAPGDPYAPEIGDRTTPLSFPLEEWPSVTLAIGHKARWVLEAFGAKDLRAEPASGRIIARIAPSSPHALLAAVFETGGEVEILDPDHIREAVRGVAETKVARLGE
ncbi:WYL domain-containing protein [Dermabacter sp. Marseille-Q3180]|uniref:WYL domain-containing protein n=1 Tax=Dermabacter sp. Marseille-Q3180 TaxID=2758090 RepID=UPI0020258BF1|nr:WYL domain-containing protein [Dermabacter sp. Marseille-Q3180]